MLELLKIKDNKMNLNYTNEDNNFREEIKDVL